MDDPHLWERAEHLGLDLERFAARPLRGRPRARERDFESGIRAGVAGTPAAFVQGDVWGRRGEAPGPLPSLTSPAIENESS